MIKTIPLSQLKLSPDNVRKTDVEAGLDELVASIRHLGLLENLIVTTASDGGYNVVDGGRRLRALTRLAQDGHLSNDHEVPCLLRAAEEATELSLAANEVRVAMHPADQVEAFTRLIDQGATVSAVAARFGVTERLVEQRLKLARVAPELLQAYREGTLTLETLMAFTLTDDHRQQLVVWKEGGPNIHPHHVRQRLTETGVRGSNKLARFVGIEAYETAGGTITRDLFSDGDTCYFDDRALLVELATAKLKDEAERLRADWAWARYTVELDYAELYRYEQLEPKDLESQVFSDEQKRRSGCIVTIDWDGELEYHQGLEEHQPEANTADTGNGDAEGAEPSEPSAKKKTRPVYNRCLTADLQAYRLQVLQAEVAGSFGAAFDLLLYSLCASLASHYVVTPLGLRLTQASTRTSLQDHQQTNAYTQWKARHEALPLDWLSLPDAERFPARCALSVKPKQTLFAFCVSAGLTAGLTDTSHPAIEHTGRRLRIQPADYWRPTALNFFGSITKAQLLAIGKSLLGQSWAVAYKNSKKTVIAKALETACAREASEQGAGWLPDGMAFALPDEGQGGEEPASAADRMAEAA